MRKRITEEQQAQILELYKTMSASRVSKIVEISTGCVVGCLKRNNIPIRNRIEAAALTMSNWRPRPKQSEEGILVKICVLCGAEKPLDAFGKRQGPSDGRSKKCKDCVNKLSREKYPEKAEIHCKRQKQSRKDNPIAHRGYDMKKRFGLDWGSFNVLFDAQGRKCAGCGATESGEKSGSWHIDHDHKCCPLPKRKTCGKCTRGILCRWCNMALGNAKEDVNRLLGLARYIQCYQPFEPGYGEKGQAAPIWIGELYGLNPPITDCWG